MTTNSSALKAAFDLCSSFLKTHETDHLAFALIDFNASDYECFLLQKKISRIDRINEKIFFDLASLSKPLTNGLSFYAKPELVDERLDLLLNHQSGLPAWGLLSSKKWREQLQAYEIKKSSTLYSDFGAIRYMLDFDKVSGESLEAVVKKYWDQEVIYWLDLTSRHHCPQYGYRLGRENIGRVHDPNAYALKRFVPHAGCFATIEGVCRTLITMRQQFGFIDQVNNAIKPHSSPGQYFVQGWDTSVDFPHVFGHLGFTGTSVWIDAKTSKGYVLLTNAVKEYWYHKERLKKLRSDIGEMVWQKFS